MTAYEEHLLKGLLAYYINRAGLVCLETKMDFVKRCGAGAAHKYDVMRRSTLLELYGTMDKVPERLMRHTSAFDAVHDKRALFAFHGVFV